VVSKYSKEQARQDAADICKQLYEHQLESKDQQIKILKDALEFYADTGNWELVLGHTRWRSNLKVTDCALFNTGGGRARMALKALEQVKELEIGN
jgi:hypothetical protein